MSLRDAEIENSYFLNNVQPYYFYNELYKYSSEIVIALGYFSRTAFCIGTDELMTFIEKNDGHIQLLCNDRLFNEDADAIENGYNLRNAKAVTLEDLKDLFAESNKDSDWKKFSFKCLSYLIALNRLEIKVFDTDRLVHFKTGYARDKEGNTVAFTGSVNYTLSALLLNYEQIMTFCSWKNENEIHVDNFIPWSFIKEDKLWNFVLACPSCNIRKSNKIPGMEYVKLIQKRNDDLKRISSSFVCEQFKTYKPNLISDMWKYAQSGGYVVM